MSNNRFKRFQKVIDNPFASVASEGVYADTAGFVDTGSFALNALLSGSIYGGLPNNKVTALAGEEATGKTFYLLGIIKHFLEADSNAIVFLFESEGSITSEILSSRGIDTERVLVIGVETVEDFRSQSMRIVNELLETDPANREKALFALDSLGNLSTLKEISDVESGKDTVDMGKRPRLIKAAFRALTMKLSKLGAPMVITNHTYDNPGNPYAGKTMGGGSALKYAANNIIFLSKSKLKEGTVRIGSVIKCTNKKSRTTKEELRVETRLFHETGLDRYYGLTDLAIEAGIWKKVSTKIQTPDGKSHFQKSIEKEPSKYFTEEVLKAIDEHVRSTFTYGAPTPEETVDALLNGDADESEEIPAKLN
jgi:RecA/RadA recombinase